MAYRYDYHVPGRTGQRLPPTQLGRLANMNGVVAVKEATGDIHYGLEVLTGTNTPILSGDDLHFSRFNAWEGKV